jgi:hypothetical protein
VTVPLPTKVKSIRTESSGLVNVPVFEMVAAQPAQAMDIGRAIADKMLSCCGIAT